MTSKRQRRDFSSKEIEIFESFWKKGMVNTRKDCHVMISKCSEALNITREAVVNWIGNRSKKEKPSKPSAKKAKPVHGPTAYSLFQKQFKRGAMDKTDYFRFTSTEWSKTSEEAKEQFKEEAEKIRKDPLKGLSSEEAGKVYLKKLIENCTMLEQLGFEVGGMACKVEDGNPVIFGSKNAVAFFSSVGQQESFCKHVIGVEKQCVEAEISRETLRREVRQIFASCWYKATGKMGAPQYNAIKSGKISLDISGLPDNIPFLEPSNYGQAKLRDIVGCKEHIRFVVCTPEPAATNVRTESEHQLQMDSTTVDASESIDLHVLSGLASGTLEAQEVESRKAEKVGIATEETTKDDACESIDLHVLSGLVSGTLEAQEVESGKAEEVGIATEKTRKARRKPSTQRKMKMENKTSDDVYAAEKLVKVRTRKQRKEFLVKWKDGTSSWEPQNNILDEGLLKAFYGI
ncbi:uncharacterized protein LOC117330234 [Pecten maximus]|uniref:uncharacterized protein LOC117330234 n=1 Tax=Pecten maximus TaxID=6579 RepID=UPI001458A13F|nr:uncharacterized protein LOC117330234 [Pecten maximus]